jgi:hypothetical protein
VSSMDMQTLVVDAKLVLEYAVRAGKLPDKTLGEAIERLEGSESAQSAFDLQYAMNTVVACIAPMTLVDLRAGRNPFSHNNIQIRRRWQISLSFATIALIVVIANYQFLVQRQESALREYRLVVEARASERITEVRKLVQQGHALAKDSCQRDVYQKARHELRQLADRSVIASRALIDLSRSSAWPMVDAASGLFASRQEYVSLGSALTHSSLDAVGAAKAESQHKPPQDQLAPDPCDESQRTRMLPSGYPDWLRNVVLDTIDEYCFASKLNVDRLAASDPIRQGPTSYFGRDIDEIDHVAKVEQRMRVHAGWLLPFLYGLLGACVYVMRRLLFDTKTAVVENVVVVLRLALGALAGVAIGWFAMPAAVSATSTASSLPYVLAFLAGFSVDILFTLLDRLNRLVLDKTLPA